MDNLSPSGEALFGTLIAAKDSPIFGIAPAFRPLPLFLPEIWAILSCDSIENGIILETHGLPGIVLEFWKYPGQSITIYGCPIRNPNRG